MLHPDCQQLQSGLTTLTFYDGDERQRYTSCQFTIANVLYDWLELKTKRPLQLYTNVLLN